jgi:hypothetical protein
VRSSYLYAYVACLSLVACSAARPTPPSTAGLALTGLSEGRVAVAGVTINSDERSVVRALGEPSEVRPQRDGITDEPAKLLTYPEVVVYLVSGRVYNLKCSSPAYSTTDGVRVGDGVEKVLRIYGVGERYASDHGEIVRYQLAGSDVYLVFHVVAGRVSMVELWFDYT